MSQSSPQPAYQSQRLDRTTPFPNILLDAAMPRLKDTEWRVLCVIVRQTLGWRGLEKGTRKQEDWITHRQFKLRTGRASEAICKAVDSLVRQGLIEVRDQRGRLLTTPSARRGSQGRLYFRAIIHAAKIEGEKT